ncbi:putative cobalamin biosynthesis-related protein [Pseudomonas mandelii JR-1]|uniref:Putative cobalamin biosynthesis-related protein n=1 Tax=Pseudomonas mandelii JR-1 TaxID=1147786 RepID=A0A024E4A4_9PSED|nr:putative cobalamin biosynthesis-related protein [Pseudomonas mandelii JR-1]
MPFGKVAGIRDDNRCDGCARGRVRHRITPPGCSENLCRGRSPG